MAAFLLLTQYSMIVRGGDPPANRPTGAAAGGHQAARLEDPTNPGARSVSRSGENADLTIRTVEDLARFAQTVNRGDPFLGKTVALAADLDLSAYCAERGGWTPIGAKTELFAGSFTGGGHTITGLSIRHPGRGYQGLFGAVDEGGRVSGLALLGCDIEGGDYTGGIAGKNKGVIENCVVTGTIRGGNQVGGVAGYNLQTIRASIGAADVEGNSMVGGIAGSVVLEGASPSQRGDGVRFGGVNGCVALGNRVMGANYTGSVVGYGSPGGSNLYWSGMELPAAPNIGPLDTGKSGSELSRRDVWPAGFQADPWRQDDGTMPGLSEPLLLPLWLAQEEGTLRMSVTGSPRLAEPEDAETPVKGKVQVSGANPGDLAWSLPEGLPEGSVAHLGDGAYEITFPQGVFGAFLVQASLRQDAGKTASVSFTVQPRLQGTATVSGSPTVGGELTAALSGVRTTQGVVAEEELQCTWYEANSGEELGTGLTYLLSRRDEGKTLMFRAAHPGCVGELRSDPIGPMAHRPLERIELPETGELTEGQRASIGIEFYPADTTGDRTVRWSSSNESVAVIGDDGVAEALSPGTAVILAQAGDKEARCILTVEQAKTGTIPVQPESADLGGSVEDTSSGSEDRDVPPAAESEPLETIADPASPLAAWDDGGDLTVVVDESVASSFVRAALKAADGAVTVAPPGGVTVTAGGKVVLRRAMLNALKRGEYTLEITHGNGVYEQAVFIPGNGVPTENGSGFAEASGTSVHDALPNTGRKALALALPGVFLLALGGAAYRVRRNR